MTLANRVERRIRRDWWLFLLALAVPGSLLLSWWLSTETGYSFLEWIRIVGLVGPLVMSLVLAFLYQGLKEIQQQQSNVMENQESLMEAEHEPEIALDRVDVVNLVGNVPHFVLYLSNLGKGTANNLTATFKPELVEDTEYDIEFQDIEIDLSRYQPSSYWGEDTDRPENHDGEIVKKAGTFLRPNEQDLPLYGRIHFRYEINGATSEATPNVLLQGLATDIDPTVTGTEDSDEEQTDSNPRTYSVSSEYNDSPSIITTLSESEADELSEKQDLEIEQVFTSSESLPEEDILRERISEILDFNTIRVRLVVSYSGVYQEEKKSETILDRVIPLEHGTSWPKLFSAGVPYSEYSDDQLSRFVHSGLIFEKINEARRSKDE